MPDLKAALGKSGKAWEMSVSDALPRRRKVSKKNLLDRAFAEGESSLSISSAYVGKLSLEYGQFHISGRTI